MSYENRSMFSSTDRGARNTDDHVRSTKMNLMAMSSFIEPMLSKLNKVKSPLKSAFNMSYVDDGRLIVSDHHAGKILSLSPKSGRQTCDVTILLDDVCPYGVSGCSVPDTVAVVHSTEWEDCIKLVSTTIARQVHVSWGRDFNQWTPRALAVTNDGHFIVSNIHHEARSRLVVYTADGQEVRAFGRPVGPGNLVFRFPQHIAVDDTTSRLMASDVGTNTVKVFDLRGHFVSEIGTHTDKDSKLDSPLGLCCDRRGNIIICDSGNGRVALFSHDGRFICNLLTLRENKKKDWMKRCQYSPVAAALSTSGNQLAVTVDRTLMSVSSANQATSFHKLSLYDVHPEL